MSYFGCKFVKFFVELPTFDLSDGRHVAKFASLRSIQPHFIIQEQHVNILL